MLSHYDKREFQLSDTPPFNPFTLPSTRMWVGVVGGSVPFCRCAQAALHIQQVVVDSQWLNLVIHVIFKITL